MTPSQKRDQTALPKTKMPRRDDAVHKEVGKTFLR